MSTNAEIENVEKVGAQLPASAQLPPANEESTPEYGRTFLF